MQGTHNSAPLLVYIRHSLYITTFERYEVVVISVSVGWLGTTLCHRQMKQHCNTEHVLNTQYAYSYVLNIIHSACRERAVEGLKMSAT